jgi:spore germination cell wall hydrolase CwlJ-like protein
MIRVGAEINDLLLPDIGASEAPLTYDDVLPPGLEEELMCMQKNIFFESRNQSMEAQLSVAWVTLNRVLSRRYPNTICTVVYQGRHNAKGVPYKYQCKFSWYCDGLPDDPNLENIIERRAWELAHDIAVTLIQSCIYGIMPQQCPEDPTDGALYYHSVRVRPYWTSSMTQTAQVGDHKFYYPNY